MSTLFVIGKVGDRLLVHAAIRFDVEFDQADDVGDGNFSGDQYNHDVTILSWALTWRSVMEVVQLRDVAEVVEKYVRWSLAL